MTEGDVKEQLVWLLKFILNYEKGLTMSIQQILNSVYDGNDTYFSFKFRMLKR